MKVLISKRAMVMNRTVEEGSVEVTLDNQAEVAAFQIDRYVTALLKLGAFDVDKAKDDCSGTKAP